MKNFFRKLYLNNNSGLTLIEIITVLAIIAIITAAAAPFISNYFGSKRKDFIVVESLIAQTFDDAVLKKRTNFLAIHLHTPFSDPPEDEKNQKVYSRNNGISVVNMDKDGNLVDSPNRMLAPKTFSDGFKIEKVLLSTGEAISEGTVLVPFYQDGYSDNVIIHILASNSIERSIVINKMQKNPMRLKEFKNFEDVWKSSDEE